MEQQCQQAGKLHASNLALKTLNFAQLDRQLRHFLSKQKDQFTTFTRINCLEREKTSDTVICGEDRNNISAWLLHVAKGMHFHPETFCTSITMLDRFLCSVNVRPVHLKLIGVACLYLSAKTLEEDDKIPDVLTLIRASKYGCSIAEVIRMEKVICDKLQWNFVTVTPLDILNNLYAQLYHNYPNLLDHLVRIVKPAQQLSAMTQKLQLVMCDYKYSQFSPATLAMTIISLEIEQCMHEWFSAICFLQEKVKDLVPLSELVECREQVDLFLTQCPYRQPFRLLYILAPQSNRAQKRKVEQMDSSDTEEDVYDDIKRLYNEHPDQKYTSCSMQACLDGTNNISLQPVAN